MLPDTLPHSAPAAPAADADATRYARQLVLPGFGPAAQARLAQARVLVVGAGGLGAPALLYLAAAGVGHLTILDDDHVAETNLQRQVLFHTGQLGERKAEAARHALLQLNPHIRVAAHAERLDPDNADALIAAHDLVLDGSDNFATRYLANDTCVRHRKPLVQGSVYQYEGQLAVWNHPHGAVNLRDLYPTPPPPDSMPDCAEAGVLGGLTGLVGSLMALEALKLLTGVGQPLAGKLWLYDALTGMPRVLDLTPDPANPLRRDPHADRSADYADPLNACAPTDMPLHLSAQQLLAWQRASHPHTLVDVRQEWEHARGNLGGRLLPLDELPRHADTLPRQQPLVLYCQTGARSAAAARLLRERFGLEAYSLAGGIAAWDDRGTTEEED